MHNYLKCHLHPIIIYDAKSENLNIIFLSFNSFMVYKKIFLISSRIIRQYKGYNIFIDAWFEISEYDKVKNILKIKIYRTF